MDQFGLARRFVAMLGRLGPAISARPFGGRRRHPSMRPAVSGADTPFRSLLLVFPDEWIAYSPTVLNLVEVLSDDFEVTTLAVESGRYQAAVDLPGHLEFIRLSPRAVGLLKKLGLHRTAKAWKILRTVSLMAKRVTFDEVIGVDAVGAWAAGQVFERVHLLSLEVERGVFFGELRQERVASVTIQTQERLSFLYPMGVDVPVFLVQNAPRLAARPSAEPRKFRPDVVMLGNALPGHGVYQCIAALREAEGMGYRLTIKGVISDQVRQTIHFDHGDLLRSGRLTLDTTYVPQEQLLDYLGQFSIGLCFYDFDLIARDDFNYLSSPSGKLFNYYAADLPVVGSDILGLQSVREFGAGVLLADIQPASVANGLSVIRNNYEDMVKNCRRAADQFDFNKAVEPLRVFLADDDRRPTTLSGRRC